MKRLDHWIRALTLIAVSVGMAIVVIQVCWISYGVFARYVLKSPDPYVTEATGLLLVALAFLGLPYAQRSDTLPSIRILSNKLSARWRHRLQWMNCTLMALVGLFLIQVSLNAFIKTMRSGVTSMVVEWPEYILWFGILAAFVLFTLTVCIRAFRRGSAFE